MITRAVLIPKEQLAALLLEGIVLASSFEVLLRCLFHKIDGNNTLIRVIKECMAVSIIIKTSLFASTATSAGVDCNPVSHVGTFFFHAYMVFAASILLYRTRTVMVNRWPKPIIILHTAIIIGRLVIGIADTIIIRGVTLDNGVCIFDNVSYWGAVYTFYDMAVDLYVTFTISIKLFRHIWELDRTGSGADIRLYVALMLQNTVRTVILAISNLISAISILMRAEQYITFIIWIVNNLLYIILVGYDSDINQNIQRIQSRFARHPHNSPVRPSLADYHHDGTQDGEIPRFIPNRSPTPSFMISSSGQTTNSAPDLNFSDIGSSLHPPSLGRKSVIESSLKTVDMSCISLK